MFKSVLSRVSRVGVSFVRWRSPAAAVSGKDPVQQLFLDKLREYAGKSSSGKLVEPSPQILKELDKEMNKLEKLYGGGKDIDMKKFPELKFDEPNVEPINEEEAAAAAAAAAKLKKEKKK